MNEQTKRVIEYCSDEWRLLSFIDDLKQFNPRGVISTAQNMTDDFIEWGNNEVDWKIVEEVLDKKINQKIQEFYD